jgi:hypothetical protein
MKCFNNHYQVEGVICKVCGASLPPLEMEDSTRLEDSTQCDPDTVPAETPQSALMVITQKNELLLKWLSNIKVRNTEEQKSCEDMLITARHAVRDAQTKEKELLQPSLNETKRIRSLFKPFIDQVERGIESIGIALSVYRKVQEKKAEDERNRILIEQANKVDEAKETGEIIEAISQPLPELAKTSQAHVGSVSYIDSFDIQIVNPDLVPRDLCDPNPVKIRARVKSGVKQIEGVLIVPKKILHTRIK